MKIFLIGFMGSGKTYWGKVWAQKNDWAFFDLDTLIEQQEGKTIAEIFAQNGEAYFRQQETAVLRGLLVKDNCIIACGGGTPCFDNNIQWMNAHGTVVYLSASPENIFAKLLPEKNKRPLLKGLDDVQLLSFIQQKLTERLSVYDQAKIILAENDCTEDTFTQKILPLCIKGL